MPSRWLATLLGVPARAALTAGIAAAVAFAAGGFLFREQLHHEQLAHEATAVSAALTPLATELRADVNIGLDAGWLLISESGEVGSWSPDLDPYLPEGLGQLHDHTYRPNTVTFHSLTIEAPQEGAVSPLAGRTVEVVCANFAFVAGTGAGLYLNGVPAGERGTLCKLALPRRADQTAATVDRFIAIGMLVTALVVGAIGWLVTSMALRSVTAITRRLAQISGLRVDQRVPVPCSRDAVAALALTVNLTLDRLQRAAQQQRRFIADASHELRSPIATLSSSLEVALAYPDRVGWRRIVADAHVEAGRLQALVDDLLTLARLEEPTAQPTGEVDLAALVYEQVTERKAARSDGPSLVAQPGEPIMIRAYPNLLNRMIRNLLDNAERHAQNTVWADVTSDPDGRVTLTVTNDGPPIPDSEHENIFLPFVRLDDARSRDTGGAGLDSPSSGKQRYTMAAPQAR
jgi:signal transduction histidine kinase